MQKTLSFFIFNWIIFNFTAVNAQEIIYRKTYIQEDIRFLKKELEEYHPNLYKFITKERFDFICDSLIINAPETANLQKTFGHLLKIVNEISCGHTSFDPFNKSLIPKSVIGDGFVWAFTNPRFLPLEIYMKDDQVFVSRSYAKDKYKFERGDEILAINNVPTKDVLKIISSYNFQHSDGENSSSQRYHLTANFKYLLYLWLGFQENYYLQIKKLDSNDIKYIKVPPINLSTIVQIDANRNIENAFDENNITFTIVDSLPSTAYLRIKSFLQAPSDNIFMPGFEKKTDYVFKQLKKEKVKNLIIDFRGNPGGDVRYALILLSYLIPKPFNSPSISVRENGISKIPVEQDLFSPNTLNKFKVKADKDFWYYNYSNQIINPKKELLFNGNVYVLINSGTFSASAYSSSKLHNAGIGTFVGVSSAGGVYDGASAGFFSNIKLPNSNLVVSLPLARIQYNLDLEKYPYSHLKPDFEVGLSFDDFLKKQDSVINYTIELIKQGKKAR